MVLDVEDPSEDGCQQHKRRKVGEDFILLISRKSFFGWFS